MTLEEYKEANKDKIKEDELQKSWDPLPERRMNPDDGEWYSWEELCEKCKDECGDEEIFFLWEKSYDYAAWVAYEQEQGEEEAWDDAEAQEPDEKKQKTE